MKIVECPGCGSTHNVSLSEPYVYCDHCETVFPLDESLLQSGFTEVTSDVTPPHESEGVEESRTVTRVEVPIKAPRLNLARRLRERKSEKAFLDYLSFTLPENSVQGYGYSRLKNTVHLLSDALPELGFTESDRGLYGFTHSGELTIAGETVGRVATGGNHGRTFIEITGKGCAWIDPKAWAAWLDTINARISRIDIAYDDHQGTHSVHYMKKQYETGAFKNRGQNPSVSQVGPWLNPELWGSGLTFYVGKRENGKMLRSYEKGRQLGDKSSPWVRHEVEFRRTREKPLTTDMLRNPLEYLVGAYKPLEWIANVIPAVIDRVKIETKISYDSLVNYAKTSYGKLIHVMNQVMGDPEKVIKKLSVEGIPRRLNPSAMVAA